MRLLRRLKKRRVEYICKHLGCVKGAVFIAYEDAFALLTRLFHPILTCVPRGDGQMKITRTRCRMAEIAGAVLSTVRCAWVLVAMFLLTCAKGIRHGIREQGEGEMANNIRADIV